MKYSIKAVIDRLENNQAVLRTVDNQTLLWPKENLPTNSNEGTVVYLKISDNQQETNNQQMLAKDILNEIIKK